MTIWILPIHSLLASILMENEKRKTLMSLTENGMVDDRDPLLLANMLLNNYIESDENQTSNYLKVESHDFSLSRNGWTDESSLTLKNDLESLFGDYFYIADVEVSTAVRNFREKDLITIMVSASLTSSTGSVTDLSRSLELGDDYTLQNVFL